ncbi:cyclase family protein (plasmid) [Marinobacter sp. M3C]|jgi:kynurenine formamidase|uniref:cyclase family protein n=1 Tax=Marinobacter sp. M3C TaxID=2917715 RepID=UPI00200E7E0E|nr:cyclase family protein [Marinobacter sp. M3C]UQG62636.1 cyclase family protein [Marinobacter sp. M3C]
MCDGNSNKISGWRGWPDLPPSPAIEPLGDWLDLSHVLDENVALASVFPKPRFERLKSMPKDRLNVTEMQMVVHAGTHVDAPRHFLQDGPAFDEIPLKHLHGQGVVVSCPANPFGEIDLADLESAAAHIREGDIVALHTGWWKHVGTAVYDDHPCLTPAAAQWLVERKVKLLATDFPSPDLAISRRGVGFNWPVHHILLTNGTLVSENITGHETLVGQRAEFLFLALNIAGSDGAPARVLARPIR